MELICKESEEPGFGSDVLPFSLLSSLLVLVNRIALQGGIRYPDPDRSSQMVVQVIDYINLHYMENISLDMLADRFFVNKYHLSHAFQKQIGTGLYQYVLRKRLLIARQLMSQGQKPAEVYAHCGFTDYAGFYRAFRKVYGVSPREYMRTRQEPDA